MREELGKKRLRRIYLFTGSEELQKDEALDELRRTAGGGVVRKFSGPEVRAEDVLTAAANQSLFEPVSVIVVRQAGKLSRDEAESLIAGWGAVEGLPPLVAWDTEVDRRHRPWARLAAEIGDVEFPPPRASEASAWVEAEARRRGHRLARGVPELLVELVGCDLLTLRRTVEVLSLAAGEGATIDEATVSAMVPAANAHAFYVLQDALTARDGRRAVTLLREAFADAQPPELLLGVLFAELRRLLIARESRSAADYPAQETRTQPWKVKDLIPASRRFSKRDLARALDRLAAADVAIKTGRGEPAALLEDWVMTVSEAGT
ncbi:MAG: polymerase subunit delta [Candidatus Binatota bacterium]|nr:polymerase subunit delta [Candidatus Binatota bacterium]